MKKLVTLIVLILLTTMFAVAQKYLTNPETRSIVLNYPDSTVKFEILNVEKNIIVLSVSLKLCMNILCLV